MSVTVSAEEYMKANNMQAYLNDEGEIVFIHNGELTLMHGAVYHSTAQCTCRAPLRSQRKETQQQHSLSPCKISRPCVRSKQS